MTQPLETRKKNGQDRCFICGGDFTGRRINGIRSEGHEFEIAFCPGCGLGRTEPFLDEKSLTAIYSSSYREDDSTRFPYPLELLVGPVRGARSRRVSRLCKPGRILDIGCGRGDFLLTMRNKGWECFGLELDARAGRYSRDGVKIRSGSLGDVKFQDGWFDAVTFWHVFEHIREPVWTLSECSRILKPGGLLVVAVPNTGSVQARMSGKGWFHLDPPFHLYHYSAENLKRLLEESGFEVVEVRHFSLEYNPYGFIQSIYNRTGMRANLLYDFLRSRAPRGLGAKAALALTALTLPVVAALSTGLSVLEAAVRAGGTIEMYARKR